MRSRKLPWGEIPSLGALERLVLAHSPGWAGDAMVLTGSAATNQASRHSDIDVLVFETAAAAGPITLTTEPQPDGMPGTRYSGHIEGVRIEIIARPRSFTEALYDALRCYAPIPQTRERRDERQPLLVPPYPDPAVAFYLLRIAMAIPISSTSSTAALLRNLPRQRLFLWHGAAMLRLCRSMLQDCRDLRRWAQPETMALRLNDAARYCFAAHLLACGQPIDRLKWIMERAPEALIPASVVETFKSVAFASDQLSVDRQATDLNRLEWLSEAAEVALERLSHENSRPADAI